MPNLLTDQDDVDALVETLLTVERYALDTEFHRERTYYPQVALVQIAYHDADGVNTTVLIDPLETDLASFQPVMESDALCILHAGIQDLEVLELACGVVPQRLFDTQIAAGFLGISSGSLASLLDRYLNVHLAKGDRLTDWLRRPLTEDQLVYAAGDVDNLLELTDILVGQLEERGRLAWAEEECQLLLDRPRNKRSPEDAVNRIKEARSLKGKAYRVATAVAAWRENQASTINVPVRQVMPDIAVVAVAQQSPTSKTQLRNIRGLDGRHLKNGADEAVLAAVQEGQNAPTERTKTPRLPDLARELRPVVTLVTAWISQLARDHQLDPALLATRADVEGLLREDPGCRLLEGWRADLVGEPIRQLVAGEAAVAFDGGGRLVLEARSRQPLITER